MGTNKRVKITNVNILKLKAIDTNLLHILCVYGKKVIGLGEKIQLVGNLDNNTTKLSIQLTFFHGDKSDKRIKE